MLDDDGSPRLTHLGLPGEAQRIPGASLPLVEVTAAGHGRGWSGNRLVGTDLGGRLRHRTHHTTRDGDWHTLTVHLHDPETGLVAEVTYRSPNGIPVLRSEVTLRNVGQTTLHLESVSSLAVGCLTPQEPAAIDAADLLWAENDWLAECRWQRQPMRLTTPAHSGRVSHANGRAGFAVNGQGTWSSCGRLPMGGLTDRHTGRTWVWQIEHNGGGWRWECGERDKAAYAALFGPTDTHHGWRHSLEPGAVFRTVPAALSFSDDGGPDEAFAALTRYRRAQRRPHADHQRLPVIFNDYMNCLMGDPTTEKLLPHIDAAADAGAEYFVIDAGWYDGDDGGWWDSVGAWQPAASRFPGTRGIHEVLDRIRERGLLPGLWLEPEVIGVRSPMAKSCPTRRSSAATASASRRPAGTTWTCATRPPVPIWTRSWTAWSASGASATSSSTTTSTPAPAPAPTPARPRAPDCSATTAPTSTGSTASWTATRTWCWRTAPPAACAGTTPCCPGCSCSPRAISRTSTSTRPSRLPRPPPSPRTGCRLGVPPTGGLLDEVAFTMANALLGRIHLSGRIPELEPEARALVHEAVAAYKAIRGDLPGPCRPGPGPSWLGRPWIALALRTPATTYLTVWRRPGTDITATLRLPHLRDTAARVDLLYPSASRAVPAWTPDTAELSLTLPTAPSAVLLRITATDPGAL